MFGTHLNEKTKTFIYRRHGENIFNFNGKGNLERTRVKCINSKLRGD